MDTKERVKSPIRRQVEIYEEAWKQDHDDLRNCWGLEDAISIGLATADVIMRAESAWRSRVFRGVEEHDVEEKNQLFLELYQLWLRVTGNLLGMAAGFEAIYPRVEGAASLRQKEIEFKKRFGEWKTPRISTAIGLRELTLSEEGARELERILESPTRPPQRITSPVSEITREELQRRRDKK